jgi:uncharacterized protein with von Willebrand factor type A (vWA) domain
MDGQNESIGNNVKDIKIFFESNGGRKVTMDEFKALSKEQRDELGKLAAKALSNDH